MESVVTVSAAVVPVGTFDNLEEERCQDLPEPRVVDLVSERALVMAVRVT